MIKRFLIVFVLFITTLNWSQKKYSGQVLDFDSSVPVAFAKITYNTKTLYTNWEGKFVFEYQNDKKPLLLSYKGYYDKTYYLPEQKQNLLIKMVALENRDHFEIYSENEVNKILKKVIENRDKNQPERAIPYFEYKNYELATISASPDSISSKIDTIYTKNLFGKTKVKLDSTNYKFKKFIQKQHIYQTEKVNFIQHNNHGTKETVLAARMAGFQKPLYEYLGLSLVPYSLYDRKLDIFEVPVKNPISRDGRKTFVYKMLDTISLQNRKVYRIYFQPKNLKSSNLRGLLFIDAQTYGVAKAYYRIYGVVNINATYTFNYNEEYKLWFPEKRKFHIIKGENAEDITILGNTIKFDSSVKDRIKTDASDHVYLKIESIPFDISLSKKTEFKNKYIKIDVREAELSKPESYWKTFEKDSTDVRKLTTYTSLDSIVASEKIEKKILFGRRIINGYVPINQIDLDLRSLVKYNNYEGFRFGVGGVTNDKLSTQYKLAAYIGYGLKDHAFKYGITPSYSIDRKTNSWFSVSYIDDLQEIGQIQFLTQNKRFKIYDPRPFNIPTFFNQKVASLFLESKFLPKIDAYFGLSTSQINPLFSYAYQKGDAILDNYKIASTTFSLQWSPFSDFMQTSLGIIEINKRFPKINFQATQAFNDVFGSDFNFTKLEAKVTYDIPYLSGQITSFVWQGGLGFGQIPITHLYSIAPNNLNHDSVLRRVTFAGKNSFETMYYNEFFSSNYTSLHIKHTLKRLKIAPDIKPVLSLVTRMAFGSIKDKENHLYKEFNTLEKGYFESGIELNKIWKGFGLVAFYRYGAYQLPNFDDNVAIKVSYYLDLGF
ncbi:DUF5686 family protein [Flavobacterium croceum]|uniref:DUF5686 family protein n=1 Tax=Flavobacterium croceum TaxID=370975 RepID=UPI0024A81AD4|nr:DUF5686 family protein [Flavobacterium croceum]